MGYSDIEVIYVKEGEDREFLIVDGAMNDLVRPAMYDRSAESLLWKEFRSRRLPYH